MMITKELLDEVYATSFDFEKFKSIDPCGIVYELLAHTDDQLDIELGALFVSMISWGNRKAIRHAARHMLGGEMQWHPGRFVLTEAYEESYTSAKNNCVYRTLNVETFKRVCRNIRMALLDTHECKNTRTHAATLESLLGNKSAKDSIAYLCSLLAPAKLGKPETSACKRMCMFLRWMTREEAPDFGIWNHRSSTDLYAIMDVHVCSFTKSLLSQKGATWKSCVELTKIFKEWCPQDPLKYDIALMTLSDIFDGNK